MVNLGEFKAGTSVFYGANFHNDTGTIEDPTSPEAQIRDTAGTWSSLTAPAKQNTKTGFYGGTVDTTSYAAGQYIIRMAGTVTTTKTVATVFCFTIVANIESDTISYTQNVLSRLGDFSGSSPNDIMGFLKAIMRKDEGILPSQVGGTYDNITDSLQALRDNPGGGGGGGTIILPVMEGAVYSSLAVQDKEVNIIRGDTPTIYFDLHSDYTGWTAQFGAKAKPKDTEYVIPAKNCTWTDVSKGQGYFELTSTETASEAKLFGEIELTKDTKHLTAMRFILRIIEDVIK